MMLFVNGDARQRRKQTEDVRLFRFAAQRDVKPTLASGDIHNSIDFDWAEVKTWYTAELQIADESHCTCNNVVAFRPYICSPDNNIS